MRIEEFQINLKKREERFQAQFTLNPAASKALIQAAETRLGKLPSQIFIFYCHFNGLLISQPFIEIYSLERLYKDPNGKVPFCVLGDDVTLCFDTSKLNEADQWTIENYKTQYTVTLTMASFWSNKMFAWLDHQRRIWEPEGLA